MLIIGLTGSIGMGKTTTAEMFRREGIPVHDSDKAVHELYQSAAIGPVSAAFPGVVDSSGVNRTLLAQAVLSDPAALGRLEAIVHPLVAGHRQAFWTAPVSAAFLFAWSTSLCFLKREPKDWSI